jgi:hypothetical protein
VKKKKTPCLPVSSPKHTRAVCRKSSLHTPRPLVSYAHMLLPRIDSLLWPSMRRDSGNSGIVGRMKLNSILNTNKFPSDTPDRVMQYEVPHYPPPAHHDMSSSAPAPQYNQNLYVPTGRIKSENGSERGVSPHPSDPSSRYSSQAPPAIHPAAYPPQGLNSLGPSMRYPSPSQLHQQMPLIQHSYHPASNDPGYAQPPMNAAPPPVQDQQPQQEGTQRSTGSGLPKAFACSTCGKGFARRSDLARHGMSIAEFPRPCC